MSKESNPYLTPELIDRVAFLVKYQKTDELAQEIADLNECIHDLKNKLINEGLMIHPVPVDNDK